MFGSPKLDCEDRDVQSIVHWLAQARAEVQLEVECSRVANLAESDVVEQIMNDIVEVTCNRYTCLICDGKPAAQVMNFEATNNSHHKWKLE